MFLMIGMSCGGPKKDNAQTKGSTGGDKAEIAVTIEPLCYFARHIAGDDYSFFSVVPVGRSPETYDPSFRERLRVEKSKAYFHINKLGLEQVLIKSVQTNNAGTLIFDLSENLALNQLRMTNDKDQLRITNYELREHDDDHDGDHDDDHDGDHDDDEDENPTDLVAFTRQHDHDHHHHGGQDPHIWTSFTGAQVMSANICQALSSINPSRSDYYQSNYQSLADELSQLEKELHEQLDTLSCRGFAIFHPALTYFAKEFDLIQYSMEEDGKDPSPASLKKLIEEARASQVKVVFVQLEFDRSYAEQIAATIGARIVMINPLDHQWDVQMRRIAKALITNGEVD
jgi:zinc transport system substrate-binding protein